MEIKIKDGKAHIYTPYSRDFVTRIKKGISGAKWNGEAWVVKETDVEEVRTIMLDVYGETDITTDEKVKVQVEVLDNIYDYKCNITLFQKTLAHSYGRDSGAKVGDDVSLVNGNITSGGSRNNPNCGIEKGSVFIVKNVSKRIFEKEEYDRETFNVTIVEQSNRDKIAALKDEKDKLIKRIAEIEVEINRLKQE